jgi:hypothetical protein
MAMEDTFVADLLPSALAFGSDVVYLHNVSILKHQFTPAAFPLLFLEELA